MRKFLFLAIIILFAGACRSTETSPVSSEDLDILTATPEKLIFPTQTKEEILVNFEKSVQTFDSIPTWKIEIADLDGDNDLDAVFANSLRNYSQVWLNDGFLTFWQCRRLSLEPRCRS